MALHQAHSSQLLSVMLAESQLQLQAVEYAVGRTGKWLCFIVDWPESTTQQFYIPLSNEISSPCCQNQPGPRTAGNGWEECAPV